MGDENFTIRFFLSEQEKNIEMTKFLVLTQNTIVRGFLEEKSPVDMSIGTEKEKLEMP